MTRERRTSFAAALSIATCLAAASPHAFGAQFKIPVADSSNQAVTGVDWYIDATASMQGFVRHDRITTYAYFERMLESRLHSLWSPSQVSYTLNRFGLQTRRFDDLKESWTPLFYAPAKGYEDTDLTVVARTVQPGHLVIILTDLFQSDSHIESFRGELLKRGLGNSFQFALIGFRAEFSGTIYDIPPSKSIRGSKSPRPVYALLLGPAPALTRLLDDILPRSGDLGVSLNAALFSNHVGTPVVPLHDLPASPGKDGYFQAQDLDPDEQLILGGPKPSTREVRLGRSAREPRVDFDVQISMKAYESLPEPASFQLTHTVWMCSSEAPGFFDRVLPGGAPQSKTKEDCVIPPAAFDIVYADSTATVKPAGPDRMDVRGKLDFGKRSDAVKGVRARSGKVYIVRTTVSSPAHSNQLPGWVSSFTQDGRKAFDPSRTPDLADFLSSMQDSVSQAGPVTLFDGFLFLDSK